MPRGSDVLVAGAGLAGHCAALAAAAAGARVLLLESEAAPGGSSAISAGFFAFAGTALQRDAGITDDAALLEADLTAVGGGAADPVLLRAYAQRQRALHDWLLAHGVRFTALEQGGGQSVPRAHRTDPATLMACLARAVAQEPRITRRLGCRAVELHRAGNRIAGLVSAAGEVLAAGAVVLATGGFSLSEDLLAHYAPGQGAAMRVGGAGCRGDGLRMARALGAGLRDMAHIQGTFGAHRDSGGSRYEALLAFYLGAIIVNAEGRRFVDESISYKPIGTACLAQPGGLAFQLFDQAVFERGEPGVPLFDFAAQRAAGRLISASSPQALARACGMDPAVLAATLATYNAGVAAGAAPGRDGLCNGTGTPPALLRPPFHAFPCGTALLATYCGLAVDAEGAVLDQAGQPIAGLFAAGEVTGGFHGAAYMTGSALGKAGVFGLSAGVAAAEASRG